MEFNELRTSSSLLIVAAATLLASVGCTNIVPEPDSAFADIPNQTYPFDATWECTNEAVIGAGFEVDVLTRDGDQSGRLITHFLSVKKDQETKIETGKRVRIRVEKVGDNDYSVRIAASIFEREMPEGDWSWKKTDPETVDLIEAELEKSLENRYNKGS